MEMDSIRKEQLIALVKERPVLWDKSTEHYKCRNSTAFAWKEVCSRLHSSYESLDSSDKENFVRHVMKKWTNLKDCWWRSAKKGVDKSMKGTRPYRYYRELSFLQKNHQKYNETFSNSDLQETDSNISENLQLEVIENPVQVFDTDVHDLTPKSELNTITEKPAEPLATENRHISFFKGILPTLQLLDEDQVLQFQINVLQILHQIRQPKVQHASSSSNF